MAGTYQHLPRRNPVGLTEYRRHSLFPPHPQRKDLFPAVPHLPFPTRPTRPTRPRRRFRLTGKGLRWSGWSGRVVGFVVGSGGPFSPTRPRELLDFSLFPSSWSGWSGRLCNRWVPDGKGIQPPVGFRVFRCRGLLCAGGISSRREAATSRSAGASDCLGLPRGRADCSSAVDSSYSENTSAATLSTLARESTPFQVGSRRPCS
jgi:hypothetical protein